MKNHQFSTTLSPLADLDGIHVGWSDTSFGPPNGGLVRDLLVQLVKYCNLARIGKRKGNENMLPYVTLSKTNIAHIAPEHRPRKVVFQASIFGGVSFREGRIHTVPRCSIYTLSAHIGFTSYIPGTIPYIIQYIYMLFIYIYAIYTHGYRHTSVRP